MGINIIEQKLTEFAGYQDGWNGEEGKAANKNALKRLQAVIGNRMQSGIVLHLTQNGEVCFYREMPFGGMDYTFYFSVDTSRDAPLEASVFEAGHFTGTFPLEGEGKAQAFFSFLEQGGWEL